MTDRKKLGVTFWATVVLVVLLAYPLSMGPAFHLAGWLGTSSFMVVYEPLELVGLEFPPFWEVLTWYLELWDIHISC
jgi:hypothetical protein